MQNISDTIKVSSNSEIFQLEYKKRKKSVIVAYYFCLLMSGFGLHKLYLGQKKQALKFSALYWIGLMIFVAGFTLMDMGQFNLGAAGFIIGLLSLAVYGIWWIYDIFTLYVQTKRKNQLILKELLATSV